MDVINITYPHHARLCLSAQVDCPGRVSFRFILVFGILVPPVLDYSLPPLSWLVVLVIMPVILSHPVRCLQAEYNHAFLLNGLMPNRFDEFVVGLCC